MTTIWGAQRPRVEWAPHRIEGTLGQDAIDLAELAGLTLDPWQQWLMHNTCSVRTDETYFNKYTKREEFRWRYFENGIIVPRQNGKGSFLEARELAGLFLFGERKIIHSAHDFSTSREHFDRIVSLIDETPALKKQMKPDRSGGIMRSHGSEGIELRNGQKLIFKTRTGSSGRGFSSDCLVLDECMILSSESVGAMFPTLAARPNAQVFYTGSAGDQKNPKHDCAHQGNVRSRATKGSDGQLFFAEWSVAGCNAFCPPHGRDREFICVQHDDPDSVESWAKANPGLGRRIRVDYIKSERASMEEESFEVERLSIGDYPVKGESWKVIKKDQWDFCESRHAAVEGEFALGVDVSPNGKWACIVAAGESVHDEESECVEITAPEEGDDVELDYRLGMHWLAERVIEIFENSDDARLVVLDNTTPAGGIRRQLEKEGIQVVMINSREYAQACNEFLSSVVPPEGAEVSLAHIGQPPLAAAIADADKRKLVDMWAWSKQSDGSDITPLVAATLAKWGYKMHVHSEQAADPWFDYV